MKKKIGRSKKADFFRNLRFILIHYFNWLPPVASGFVRDNKELLEPVFATGADAMDVARYINDLKEKGIFKLPPYGERF